MAEVRSKSPLEQIRDLLNAGEDGGRVTVRTLIAWFGAERRGVWVEQRVRARLEDAGLETVPDFDIVPLDASVGFRLKTTHDVLAPVPATDLSIGVPCAAVPEPIVQPVLIAGGSEEPAFRVGRLDSAINTPLSVKPDAPLQQVITLMLLHDFSQLPVMQNERDVKGIVSWEVIGSKLAVGSKVSTAADCMRPHHEVGSHESLFKVISQIVEHSCVLVRDETRVVTGIVTTADLSLQFQQLSEPFLLLSEIESHIRALIAGRFTQAELKAVRDPSDSDREISSVSDLTFGEYIRLLESPERWLKTGIKVDRGLFVKELDEIRRIRNDVVHFDPDGIEPKDHARLLKFVQFIHEVRAQCA